MPFIPRVSCLVFSPPCWPLVRQQQSCKGVHREGCSLSLNPGDDASLGWLGSNHDLGTHRILPCPKYTSLRGKTVYKYRKSLPNLDVRIQGLTLFVRTSVRFRQPQVMPITAPVSESLLIRLAARLFVDKLVSKTYWHCEQRLRGPSAMTGVSDGA